MTIAQHKRKAQESEKFSEKFAATFGLTVEDLRILCNKKH